VIFDLFPFLLLKLKAWKDEEERFCRWKNPASVCAKEREREKQRKTNVNLISAVNTYFGCPLAVD
jgi:hypothetical protein